MCLSAHKVSHDKLRIEVTCSSRCISTTTAESTPRETVEEGVVNRIETSGIARLVLLWVPIFA